MLTRGGGSLEDLWCFNEERLVREIHAAQIPVISAIGHEIDVTLADLVADLRALTPTEAGEHAVPSQSELLHQLHSLARLMSASLQRGWQAAKVRVEALAQRRVLADPHQLIHDRMHQLDDFAERLNRAVTQRQSFWRHQTDQWTSRLQTLNPLAVLERGYSLTQRSADDAIVRDSRQVQAGDEIRTRLARGQLISRVVEILDDSPMREEPRP